MEPNLGEFQTDLYENDDEESLEGGWIQWFCSLEGHEFFCEVDPEFIEQGSNLFGLRSRIPHFEQVLDSKALEMLLSSDIPDETDLQNEEFLELYQEAIDLYGLLHVRFIYSQQGMPIMREKFLSGAFGTCPRVMCERYNVLPLGVSDQLRVSRVKVYCPRCKEAYIPKDKLSDVDGGYFGSSFPHVFLKTYPDLQARPCTSSFVPKVFGFKIHQPRQYKSY